MDEFRAMAMESSLQPGEGMALLERSERVRVEPSPARRVKFVWLAAIAATLALLGIGLTSRTSRDSEEVGNDAHLREGVREGRPLVANSYDLSFTALNEYTKITGPVGIGYPWLSGKTLVEPYRATTLTAFVNDAEASTWAEYESSVFEWSINGDIVGYGSELDVQFTQLETNVVMLRLLKDSVELATLVDSDVICKYVRREIRSLTDADRDAYLDAVETMYTVSSADGQARYGRDYKDMDYFNLEHLTLAGDQECDHMHDGQGFFTQHIAMTNEFERALQAIDPSVAIPYWDFTVEGQKVYESGDHDDYYNSLYFSDDWFGGFDEDTYTIPSGRWSNIELTSANWNVVHNGYGYMRGPWNANNISKITRHKQLCGYDTLNYYDIPRCYTHYKYTVHDRSLKDFIEGMSYDPHGPVHVSIGGAWNCEDTYSQLDSQLKDDIFNATLSAAYMTPKFLWRAGLFECPSDCADGDDCSCSCPTVEEDLADGKHSDYLQWMFQVEGNYYGMLMQSTEIQEIYIRGVCSSAAILGDQLEAGSPFDPAFWSLHPTLERLFQWKYLKGYLTDTTWATEDVASIGYHYVNCTGHYEHDEIYWGDPKSGSLTHYSNGEFLEILLPTSSDNVAYIYDNFEWPHCEGTEHDIGNIPDNDDDASSSSDDDSADYRLI